MLRRLFSTLIHSVLLSLLGCGSPDSGPAKLDDYQSRLARSLSSEIADTEVSKAPTAPAIIEAGLAPIDVPVDQIGLLDFLSLSECELQQNLGRRNSHLGRTASPSQQLLLDLEFLRLAPTCSEMIKNDSPELALQINQLAQARAAALPMLIYNAILAGPEWRRLWRLPGAIGNYPQGTGGDITDALGQLAAQVETWLEGDWAADNMEFELLLSELRSGDGGALLAAAAVQAQGLSRSTEIVELRARRGSICPYGDDTTESRTLKNVAARYFARGVQPWLADLQRRQTALLPATQQLESALHEALPEDYQRWQQARDQHLSLLTTLPREHALALSELLAPCGGVRPGTPRTTSGASEPR